MNHYNELSRKIFNEYANHEKAKNVCISTDCVTLGFEALYLGTGGVTRQSLDNKYFMEKYSISRTQKSKSTVTGITLLSREDVKELIPQYKKDIKKYCTDKNFLHYRIKPEKSDTYEKREKIVEKINAYFKKKTDGVITQIVDNDIVNLYPRGSVTFICKTKFNATWKRPFNSKKTDKNGIFFVMPNISEQVDMMIDDKIHSILVSKMETDLNVTAIKLPYKDEFGDSYIAIMPNRVATKNELLSLFSSLNLNKFLSSFVGVRCCYLGVPKYTTKTDLTIEDERMSIDKGLVNIEALTDFRRANFSNMFDGGFSYDYLNYYVKTIVTVNEVGTQVDATFTMLAFDGMPDGRKIELNRPFLYLIVDRKNYISTIGTFMGP